MLTMLRRSYRAFIAIFCLVVVSLLFIPAAFASEETIDSSIEQETITTDMQDDGFLGPRLLTSSVQENSKALVPTPGWELFGTCEWQIDDAGCLTIRPVNNGTEGYFVGTDANGGSSNYPWIGEVKYTDIYDYSTAYADIGQRIKDFKIIGTVKAKGSLYGMFMACTGLERLVFPSNFDTAEVVSMRAMFWNCSNLKTIDFSNLNTSSIKNMSFMFNYCKVLDNLDLRSFDTSSCENMYGMFWDCNSLKGVDLSTFNTSNVNSMSFMFSGCSQLESLNLSSFDTSKVQDTRNMFAYCSALKGLDLSSFNTHSLRGMEGMFAYCSSLEQIDLSSFDTSNVTRMSAPVIDPDMYIPGGLFEGCASLRKVDLTSFDTSKVTCFDHMFNGCSSLKQLDLSSFDTTKSSYYCPDVDGTIEFEMFDNALAWISISDKFTLQAELPDKTWYNSKGESFTPATIPAGVADVYQTGESIDADPDPDNYYLSTTGDSDLKGRLVISDSDVAKELDGCYLRINKSEKMSDTLLKRNLLNFLGTGSRILDILDVDIVDASGNTIPWSNPDHGITVQFEKDYLSECEDKNFSIGIYYVKSSSEFEEHKAYWNQSTYEISFDTTHFSTYAVTASPIIENTPSQINKSSVSGDPKANKLAQTGDVLGFSVFAVVELILVAAGFALIARSRMSRAKER